MTIAVDMGRKANKQTRGVSCLFEHMIIAHYIL